jgi:hypothetical protein
MSNRYVTIQSDHDKAQGIGPLKLRVVHGTWKTTHVQHKTITDTIGDTTSVVLGTNHRLRRFLARIKYNEETGYATLADLERWMSGDLTSDHMLDFVDPFGTLIRMVPTNDFDPDNQMAVLDGADSFYLSPVELKELK